MKHNLHNIIGLIDSYVEKGLISEQTHPDNSDVKIYNYTDECQFSGLWDDVTRNCRGLIVNRATGEVLARPFKKFFNYSEHTGKGWGIPNGEPRVYEKLDGSLGIYYWLNDRPWIATRGSFISDQALWATDWFRKNIPAVTQSADINLYEGITPLFEIIAPFNRIVVNYDYSGLVHIATIDIETGRDVPHETWTRKAKEIPFTSFEQLEKLDEPNSEGFVIFFPAISTRMKIKFPEYVRLHKIVTGLSEIGIWEHIKNGGSIEELAKDVPDEFYGWLTSVTTRLQDEFTQIERHAGVQFAGAMMDAHPIQGEDVSRKDKAISIQKNMDHPALGFALLDGKPIDQMIWKMIRPRGQKTFTVDPDA